MIKARFSDEPLWLMDGSAFVFRGFYANRGMTRSDGLPVGAIYIVARILLRILREEQPRYFAFLLDGHGRHFRHEVFPAYKANRDATPEGLVAQLEPIRDLVAALGMHIEVSSGCEADDCIASLASRFPRPVVIVGTDKDLRQCLSDRVMMWDPAARHEKVLTLDSFAGETGLSPEQWPDLQALVGDSSDNIPGIPGIGPRTAEKILREFPRLEDVRDHFSELAPGVQKKLDGHLDDMFLYRQLTTLRTTCCAHLNLEDLELKPVNLDRARTILDEFELPSLRRELESMLGAGILAAERKPSGTEAAPTANTRATGAGTVQGSLLECLSEPAGDRSPDLSLQEIATPDLLPECSGQKIALLQADGNGWILGTDRQALHYVGETAALVRSLSRARCIVARDVKQIWRLAPEWKAIPVGQWYDLALAAYLLDPEEGDMSWPRLVSRFAPGEERADASAAGRAHLALHLAGELERRLAQAHLDTLLHGLEMPLIPVLTDMEQAGIHLDRQALAHFLDEVRKELEDLTRAVYAAAGDALADSGGTFNIRSSKQLAVILYDRLGLPHSRRTHGGQPRTDQESLEKLQGKHPIIDALLAFRKLEKIRSTYLEPLPRLMDADGRIRTTFNQTATATGRLSSSNPNLQNIPIRGKQGQRMRACFTAMPGNLLISADYSQIELRVLAHLSREPALLDAFRHGEDIHARTAGLLFGCDAGEVGPDQRRSAKTINFGLIYGMGPQSLARSLGISLGEAKNFISHYFAHMSRLKEFYDGVEQQARAQGFVTTLAGRRRFLPDIWSENRQLQSQARRQAINTLVQGSAADIIKLAMIAVHSDPLLGDCGARLLLQVHDELVLEVPQDQAGKAATRVATLMQNVRPGGRQLDVPLVADAGIGQNWGEAH